MSLSRTISKINGDFSQKSQNSAMYFVPPLTGLPLDLGIGAQSQKIE